MTKKTRYYIYKGMRVSFILLFLVLLPGCNKEVTTFSENVSETFYVENEGSSMRVLAEGNTAGNTFILIIHGGPGASSFVYNTTYISRNLENKYALVYWDQRNAGASQGNNNGDKLTLDQIVEDLKKVIEVLKYRYGQNINLFLMGHSFGGLIAADFITRPDLQAMVKGLINVDGSHNYPLNDTLTRQKLLSYGKYQVSQKLNVESWKKIISYCNTHTGNFTLEESQQLEKYASEAESYVDSVKQVSIPSLVLKYLISDKYPLSAILGNLIYSEDSDLNQQLSTAQFSTKLYKVSIPVLVLWGKYDFICPPALAEDFYNRIGSTEKKIVFSPVSGHNLMLQDEKLFCDEVKSFVSKYK